MIDERINFRHIRCFLEIARVRSISQAAQNLNIAQSAMSRSVADLEAIVGAQLFVRNRRGSHMTRVGRQFHALVATGAAQIRQAYTLTNPNPETPQTITIGAVPSALSTIVPEAILTFRATNRFVTVRMIQGHNESLLTMLRAGEVDVVVGRLLSTDAISGLSFVHLRDEAIEFHVEARHPLAEIKSVLMSDLTKWPIVVNLPETGARAELGRLMLAAGVQNIPELVETNSSRLSRTLVMAGRHSWLTPEGAVAPDIADGSLVRVNVIGWSFQRPLGIWSNPNTTLSPKTQAFLRVLQDIARPET